MWEQLHSWLISVEAHFPEPDPRYSPAKTEAKFRRIQTELKERLEQTHARMLESDWKPNTTWWGSFVTED